MERPGILFFSVSALHSLAAARPKSLNSGRCRESEEFACFRHFFSLSPPVQIELPAKKVELLTVGPSQPKAGHLPRLCSISPILLPSPRPRFHLSLTAPAARSLPLFHFPSPCRTCSSIPRACQTGKQKAKEAVAAFFWGGCTLECYCEQEPPPKKAKLAQKLSQAMLSACLASGFGLHRARLDR